VRCLIVVPSLTRAGAETQAVDLANGLASYGHSVHLLAFERNLDQLDRLKDVTFHHVARRSKFDVSFVDGIAEVIRSQRINVILGVLLISGLVSWLASRKVQVKPRVIAAVHTTKSRGIKEELQIRLLYRRVLRRLSAVIFVCQQQRQYWIQKFPELQPLAHIVYNGVEIGQFDRREFENDGQKLLRTLGVPDAAFVFTCIAGFRPEKGHALLVDAFSKLPGKAYLLLAGEGREKARIEALVRSRGLDDRVRFLGNISDVRPLITASNATVLASTAVETFSMAMLESMALGVPMIAPCIAGLPEAIAHRESGLLFPIGDAAALAAEMQAMMNDPGSVRRMGEIAHNRVRESFTRERMLRDTERILESQAGSGSGLDGQANG
jgi:glycosyltransferase involved in cell wall biosynthesis